MPEPIVTAARRRDHWPAIALALLAGVLALWARHHLFPAYSWNRDEPVYLWQVDALRAGHLTSPDGGHPDLFQPWLSARGHGVLFTQYTLGWPLVLLAAAVLTGAAGNALLLGAFLAVIGTYVLGLELLRDRRVSLLAAGLMVASPILPIQGGAYLSYLFTLGLGLLFGALLLSGIRLDRPMRLAAAGLLLGWIFLTRPYDAVLWGAAFAVFALIRERSRWTRVVGRFVLCGATALPLVVAALAYNRHVTGGWLRFPISAADPMDTFGFGPKRLMPTFEVVDYSLSKALRATAKNAFVLPWFLAGSYVGLVAAGVGLWQRRREQSSIALVLIGAVFPLGYVVFWGNHLSSMAARISGPIYFVPLYPPICLLIASVVVRWWTLRRRLAHVLLAALVVGTIPASVSRFQVNQEISRQQAPWRTSVASIRGRAIVVVADTAPYLLYLNPFSSNGTDLDGRILYAADAGPSVLDLIAEQPDRRPYLQQGTVAAQDVGPREHPAHVEVGLTPIAVRRGHALSLTVTVTPRANANPEHLDITTGGASTSVRVPSDRSAGAGTTVVTVVPPGSTGGLALVERGTIAITLGGTVARERIDLAYRVVDGNIEVLLPASTFQNVVVKGERAWRRTLTLADLHVEVATSPRQ
jgi:hypothetical protein